MISKTAEYALRAVVCLAHEPERAQSADVLSKATLVPRRYLHKVLQDLVRDGLIQSQSGPGGGYSIAKDSAKITILAVVNAVEPVARIRRCPLGLSSHQSLCPLHAELDRAYAATESAFGRVSIAQLLKSASPQRPLCEVQ